MQDLRRSAGGGRHIHLDPVGGIAGDMFVAAVADALPDLRPGLLAAVQAVGLPPSVTCRLVNHRDHALTGSRFDVAIAAVAHDHDHGHDHVGLAAITERLTAAALSAEVRRHALGIFRVLAEAEGQVHGCSPDAVTFHEIGAWDSLADIVGAAALIDALQPATWSVAPLPMGSGQVASAHGRLPVPAPATVRLLQGYALFDDGLPGERVTPTGAAILRYLGCASGIGAAPRRLEASGIGFGSRRLPGLSNILRVLAFAAVEGAPAADEVVMVNFEVDDQTGEDLALGLDRLRAMPEVLDVVQMPAFGKKGRLCSHVQVLVRPDGEAAAVAACFRETSSIGLRLQRIRRAVLDRQQHQVAVDGRTVEVKASARPGEGWTAKAGSGTVADAGGRTARESLRHHAEAAVLRQLKDGDT